MAYDCSEAEDDFGMSKTDDGKFRVSSGNDDATLHLAKKVIESQLARRREDIVAWAKRIAADVAQAAD